MNDRTLTIFIIGLAVVIALVGAIVLFLYGYPEGAGAVLAVTTGGLGLLAPSPLSKTASAPDASQAS